MSVSCALYSWKKTGQDVLVIKFDRQPQGEDVQHLVDVLPELNSYRQGHPRLVGIFDLQENLPANLLEVVSRAVPLSRYRQILSNTVLVNSHQSASLADMLEQVNVFVRHGVFVVKSGPADQQKKDIETINKHDQQLATLVKDYIRYRFNTSNSGPFAFIEKLIGDRTSPSVLV
jgi:hypothetical protein